MIHRQALAALLLVACSNYAQAQTDTDWPTYNHDVLGWRFNASEKTLSPANVGRLVEKWRFPAADSKETIGAVHVTPAVVDGEVYFGTGTFPAFYKLGVDGKLKWIYRSPARQTELPPATNGVLGDKLGSMIKAGGIMSSALVVDGAVYFADTGGWIYCLDAATGAERWTLDTRGPEIPRRASRLRQVAALLADSRGGKNHHRRRHDGANCMRGPRTIRAAPGGDSSRRSIQSRARSFGSSTWVSRRRSSISHSR